MTLDQPLSIDKLKTAKAFQAHSPDLVTKEQFKLVLSQKFRVTDVQLSGQVFSICTTRTTSNNSLPVALDIREVIGNMIFWLRGDTESKWRLFFTVFSDQNGHVFSDNICKVIEDALHVFRETFFLAKQICDGMNT